MPEENALARTRLVRFTPRLTEADANVACETECGVGVRACQAGVLESECSIPDEDNLCLADDGDAGGCGCRSTDGKNGLGGFALVFGVVGMLLWRRRRSS